MLAWNHRSFMTVLKTFPSILREMPMLANFSTAAVLFDENPRQNPPKMSKYLIVGLGNHDYPETRHSVGMQVVNKLVSHLGAKWKRDHKNCAGFVSTADVDGISFVMLKPKMPMNVNGTSVAKTARHYGISAENVYLFHDDLDKRLGYNGIKESGSASGHNGVKSVLNSMRTDEIPRIRIGIDRPTSKDQVGNYVLSPFSREEQRVLRTTIPECLQKFVNHLGKRTGKDLHFILQTDREESRHPPDIPKRGANA